VNLHANATVEAIFGGSAGVDSTTGVILNVTAINATQPTYLTFHAANVTRPDPFSNLNPLGSGIYWNQVTVAVGNGTGGSRRFKIYNAGGSIDVICDLVAYIT